MQILNEIICNHPFFEGFDERYLSMLCEAATLIRFEADQLLFQEHKPATHFYLVHQGRVALETTTVGSETIIVQTISAGDALGWSWMFPPYRWRFSARAVNVTEVIAVSASFLRSMGKLHPEFGYELTLRVAGIMGQRLRAARLQLVNFQAKNAAH
ncbi:MAG: cyclic nucleotide-binding domain-containing protein [Chthoniobacterales bacterium]